MAPRYPEFNDQASLTYSELHSIKRDNSMHRAGSGNQDPPRGPKEPVDTQDKDLLEYVDIFLKRLWLIVGIFLLCIILAYGYAKSITPTYRSDATLEVLKVNQESIKTIGEQLEKGLNLDEAFATEAEIIRSRALAKSLIAQMDDTHLREFTDSPVPNFLQRIRDRNERASNPESGIQAKNAEGDSAEDTLVDAVLSRVSANRQGRSRLLRLSFEARDPIVARDLLQQYIDIYLERNLVKRRKNSIEAVEWLKKEIERVEKKLVKSLAALVKFTNEHGMVSLDDNANHILKFFNSAAEGLVKSREQRVQLEAYLKERPSGSLTMLPADVEAPELGQQREKLAKLESEYSELKEIYSDSYPKLAVLKKQIDVIKAKIKQREKQLVNAALDSAMEQEKKHQEAFERARADAMSNNNLNVQYAVLKKDVETNGEVYRVLLQKTKEMQLNTQIIGHSVAVVDKPTLPVTPIKPKKKLFLLVGLLTGLMLGISSALVMEHLDDKVRSAEEIQRALQLPTLGVVPDAHKLKTAQHRNVSKHTFDFIVWEAPRSPVSEAVRNVKTSIFLSAPSSSLQTLVVTSAGPAEGKTFISLSLSTVMSSRDKKVLLIDADMRRPRVAKVFGQRNSIGGLSTLLTRDDVKLGKLIRRSNMPGFYYLTAGPIPPDPVRLLESNRMRELAAEFRKFFDVVLFDAPPIVGFSDAQVLSAICDGTILVAREGYVPMEILAQAKAMAEIAQANILGVVLNMAEGGTSYYGKYRYHKYYSRYYSYYSSDEPRSKQSNNGDGNGKLRRPRPTRSKKVDRIKV